MEKIYTKPVFEEEVLEVEDIITTSSLGDDKLGDIWTSDGSRFTKEG